MRSIHGGDLLVGRFALGSLKVTTFKKARLLNSRAVKLEVGSNAAAAKLCVLFPNSDPVAKIFPQRWAFFTQSSAVHKRSGRRQGRPHRLPHVGQINFDASARRPFSLGHYQPMSSSS